MLRKLDFEGNQERFDLLWQGWLFGVRAEQTRNREPNREVARRRASVSRKLKKVSTESKRALVGTLTHRDLIEHVVTFEQPELELLIKTLEEADWMPEVADDAFDMIDWVSAAEKVER